MITGLTELTEIFINVNDENYDEDATISRVLKAIDRDDVDGVLMAFTQGISVFIESVNNPDLNLEQYQEFVISSLKSEFNDEIGEIVFNF